VLGDVLEPNLRGFDVQLDASLGSYARNFASHPVWAVAGARDERDKAIVAAACARAREYPAHYVARGCELDASHALARLDAGALVLVLLDSSAMLRDKAFRAASLAALHAELASLRQERPGVWLGVALSHPLESFGSHNGAEFPGSLHKDLYPLFGVVPWALGLEGDAVYAWRVRGLRRDLYAALAESPVDVVFSGLDESLQLVELEHPGARWQIISGAGARHSRVKRWGLDWLWLNRLTRSVGASSFGPSVRHQLVFAAGRGGDVQRGGYGYAVLGASAERLRVEFWDLDTPTPLGAFELRR
jgi:hypothetical protein